MKPTDFGRYRVVERIADGGFASVYLADDPALAVQVAVKVLKPELATDIDIRARFISEARVMRQLATPALVTVHDISEHEGLPYFVMEYCQRGTLAARLAEPPRNASIGEALQLARFLTGALVPVHAAGIAHRDIKPANLLIRTSGPTTKTVVGDLLGPDEELVLGDFGLAKFIDQSATRFTLAIGTPGFSAPEQLTGVGSIDGRADIYAASATIVASMSGVQPQIVSVGGQSAFSPVAMSTTGALQAELARGLSFDRFDRHETMTDWYAALFEASKSSDQGAASSAAGDGAIDLGIDGLADVHMIGRGGFSVVYSAQHTLFQRRVAVKVLSRQLDDSDRRRFERECQLMARMSDHPNVVTVHNAGYTSDESAYVMMELVEGGSLADLLDARGRVPWSEAVSYITPIAHALGHGHYEQILHRDVKPENILLDGGRPKLADFGIASLQDATGATSTHVTASWLHTAPETFENKRDERSDIYSLASTLYHLVAGNAPFWRADDNSLSPLMKRLITEAPPAFSPGLGPDGADAFFAMALAKNPDDRPQDTGAFVDALNRVGQAVAGATPSTGPPPVVMRAFDVTSPANPMSRIESVPPATIDPPKARSSRLGAPSAHEPNLGTPMTQNDQTVVVPAARVSPPQRLASPTTATHLGGGTVRRLQATTAPTQVVAPETYGGPAVRPRRQRRGLGQRLLRSMMYLLMALIVTAFGLLVFQAVRPDLVVELAERALGREQGGTGTTIELPPAGPTDEEGGSEDVPEPPPTISLPNTVGMTADEARAALEADKFEVTINSVKVPAGSAEIGRVITQTPNASTVGAQGSRVQLSVGFSDGLAVPDLTGKGRQVAINTLALAELGFEVDYADVPEGSNDIDKVVGQQPAAGAEVPEGTTVQITVGRVGEVSVPAVVRLRQAQATGLIEEANLTVLIEFVSVEPGSRDIGTVTEQEPPARAKLKPGSEVTIWIADDNVVLPDLVGMEELEARNALRELGLKADVAIESVHPESPEVGQVLGQTITPQARVPRNTTVRITVGVKPRLRFAAASGCWVRLDPFGGEISPIKVGTSTTLSRVDGSPVGGYSFKLIGTGELEGVISTISDGFRADRKAVVSHGLMRSAAGKSGEIHVIDNDEVAAIITISIPPLEEITNESKSIDCTLTPLD